MATIMLIPGYWLGAWAWEKVAPKLRNQGHRVYPLALYGVGERAQLAEPNVNLETHITDIVNFTFSADLQDVVLVGHSGGGIPVTGVTDRIPERLSRVVYVDSGPLPDGMSQFDTLPPEQQEKVTAQVANNGDGWRYEMPPWEDLAGEDSINLRGLDETELSWLREHATAQPFKTATQPLHLTNPERKSVPKTLITCTWPLVQIQAMMNEGHPFFAELAGQEVDVRELPTGHWPMVSRPAELAELLDEVATQK